MQRRANQRSNASDVLQRPQVVSHACRKLVTAKKCPAHTCTKCFVRLYAHTRSACQTFVQQVCHKPRQAALRYHRLLGKNCAIAADVWEAKSSVAGVCSAADVYGHTRQQQMTKPHRRYPVEYVRLCVNCRDLLSRRRILAL